MTEKKFKIISDSCCDLTEDIVKKLDIDIVSLYVAFGDGKYLRDHVDFTYEEFYQRMHDNPSDYPKTSLPGIDDYMKAWEPYVKKGIPVMSISMTSKMSGSFNSARTAKEEMMEIYPEAEIEVIDSLSLTILEGLLVYEACKLRDSGMELGDAAEKLKSYIPDGRAYFTVADLSYLSKGGRIGNLVKLAAVGLGIKPVILFNDGNISLSMITRSRTKSLKELGIKCAEYFINEHENPEDYYVGIAYGFDSEAAVKVKEAFTERLEKEGLKSEPSISRLGTMVGAHNGPYLVGIAVLKKH
ncbi:MAG: DegV family protein [Eubacteriales bacterium]|nr:DegV family protein [Eubacteriales bacterium]